MSNAERLTAAERDVRHAEVDDALRELDSFVA